MLADLERLLAPGDLARAKEPGLDWASFEGRVVRSPDDPDFERAYEVLWREFGSAGEIEVPAVLALRLGWDPRHPDGGLHLLYRMVLLMFDGRFAAARDHTAIVPADGSAPVVHLSHLLVAPEFRRTAVTGIMRAVPLLTARECLEAAGRSVDEPVTLVAEMEHPDPANPARMRRLRSYAKAGFLKPDPGRVPYLQPDFRDPEAIDAAGGQPKPLPFALILRRSGTELSREISGAEVRHLATTVYRMYGLGFRERDMAPVWANLERFPADDAAIALVPPEAG